jgi:hypothetical protein
LEDAPLGDPIVARYERKNGVLRIGTFDRSYDPANHKYGFTVLTRTGSGFASTQVTDILSDPTKNDRWFARNLNSAFPNATAFLGDYANSVVAYWTDMRNPANFGGVTRSGEDAYFAKTRQETSCVSRAGPCEPARLSSSRTGSGTPFLPGEGNLDGEDVTNGAVPSSTPTSSHSARLATAFSTNGSSWQADAAPVRVGNVSRWHRGWHPDGHSRHPPTHLTV